MNSIGDYNLSTYGLINYVRLLNLDRSDFTYDVINCHIEWVYFKQH